MNSASPSEKPALGRPWSEWTLEQKKAGEVLGFGEDYMSKHPTCFDYKCWDLSHPEDRYQKLTPLSPEAKTAFKLLGGTREGFEMNNLRRLPCPLKGKCCFCTGVYRSAPPPPECMRGKICQSEWHHCHCEFCQPHLWTRIL